MLKKLVFFKKNVKILEKSQMSRRFYFQIANFTKFTADLTTYYPLLDISPPL